MMNLNRPVFRALFAILVAVSLFGLGIWLNTRIASREAAKAKIKSIDSYIDSLRNQVAHCSLTEAEAQVRLAVAKKEHKLNENKSKEKFNKSTFDALSEDLKKKVDDGSMSDLEAKAKFKEVMSDLKKQTSGSSQNKKSQTSK